MKTIHNKGQSNKTRNLLRQYDPHHTDACLPGAGGQEEAPSSGRLGWAKPAKAGSQDAP